MRQVQVHLRLNCLSFALNMSPWKYKARQQLAGEHGTRKSIAVPVLHDKDLFPVIGIDKEVTGCVAMYVASIH